MLQTEPSELAADPEIELGPLGPEAVAEIARLYLPARGEAGLAAESGGIPAAVHRLAAVRARERAAEALDVSATRTAAEREGPASGRDRPGRRRARLPGGGRT